MDDELGKEQMRIRTEQVWETVSIRFLLMVCVINASLVHDGE